jgi:hypothetical protein
MENKTSKYFKYAIGEIVLVVIGILIALSINNWNETRKIRKSEQEILQNLKNELIINKMELEKIYNSHLKAFSSGITLLQLFNTDVSTIPVTELDSILAEFEMSRTLEVSDGYIKSLLASGKADYIQNSDLKAFVGSFDSQVIDATEEIIPIRKLTEDRLWPLIDGKISSSNRIQYLATYSNLPKGSYTSNYIWFFENREIEDIVSNIMAWRKDLMEDEKTFLDNINLTIKNIEKELNQ